MINKKGIQLHHLFSILLIIIFVDRDGMAQILCRINQSIVLFSRPFITKCIKSSAVVSPMSRFFGVLSQNQNKMPLLQTSTPNVQQCCGMKVKGKLRRRCKDCYFVWREERKLVIKLSWILINFYIIGLYVMCKTHGRHKQMSMKRKPHNAWILTHASQSKMREW